MDVIGRPLLDSLWREEVVERRWNEGRKKSTCNEREKQNRRQDKPKDQKFLVVPGFKTLLRHNLSQKWPVSWARKKKIQDFS